MLSTMQQPSREDRQMLEQPCEGTHVQQNPNEETHVLEQLNVQAHLLEEPSEENHTLTDRCSIPSNSLSLNECTSSHAASQIQFCDACNTACVFMTGRRRKLQVRYEGYVLVKRVPTAPSFMRTSLPYVSAHHAPHERRHSFADLLDEESLEHEPGCATTATTSCTAQPPPRAPLQIPWRRTEEEQHFVPYKKIVNVTAEGGKVPVPPPLSTSSSTISMGQHSVVSATETQKGRLRREKKPRAHQRLCRKKSRSQDNLSGRGITGGDISTILNNTIQPPPLTSSLLSRSEGSIHNVHAITLAGTDGGVGGGAVGLVGLPRKLLSRVTDEVGQWVFDMEGWNEQYLTLNDSTISIRNVSTHIISKYNNICH